MKETKEAIVGVIAIAKEVLALSKDGLQVSDAVALASKMATDEAFRNKVILAVQGCEKIPVEIVPVTAEKVIELIVAVMAELK